MVGQRRAADHAQGAVLAALAVQAGADRSAGTNGWLSSWGTNAHGEIAGVPPAGAALSRG